MQMYKRINLQQAFLLLFFRFFRGVIPNVEKQFEHSPINALKTSTL